jgi:NAD(P)H-hydrate repair Nnr-like enzyme with NAD(P)H-hydrate epimerase domain
MQLLTAEQYRTLEAEMISATKPGELMELAGAAIVLEIEKRSLFEQYSLAVVLCGKGNNGGDGWVVARRLHESERPVERVIGQLEPESRSRNCWTERPCNGLPTAALKTKRQKQRNWSRRLLEGV